MPTTIQKQEFLSLSSNPVFMYFSRLMDRDVLDASGDPVGELYDILVKSAEVYPQSVGLVIRKGFLNRVYAYVAWHDVAEIAAREIRLKITRPQLKFVEQYDNPQELSVRRDVLDQQVVDTYNHKVIRVNDVHLLSVDNMLMVAHVDISPRGLIRRLGYEKIVDAFVWVFKRNAKYLNVEHLISWKYIQPLTINPSSMTIQITIPQKKLSSIPAADFGEIFQDLNIQHRIALFKSMDITTKVKIFTNIEFKDQELLIEELGDKQTIELLNAMPSDEATDFLEKLPKDTINKYLGLMETKQAKKLSELMGYSSDSAGGLMTKDFLVFPKGTTIEAVLKSIKERSFKVEPIQFVYIVDEHNRFIGSANFRHLMMAAAQDPVEKAAFTKTYCVKIDSSVKEVAYLMEKYKYYALAVVDENNILQGVITVDDILSQLVAIAWRRLKKIRALLQQPVV